MDPMPYMKNTPAINKMPGSENKRPPLPVHDTKFPAIDEMPSKKHKSKEHPSYETEEEFMADPSYRKDVEEYDAT